MPLQSRYDDPLVVSKRNSLRQDCRQTRRVIHFQCAAFSPQACLRELRSKPHNRNDKFIVHMTSDSMEFSWLNGRALTVHCRPPGFLPTIRVFRDAHFIAKRLARSSPRTMMSAERRMLLRWHLQGVLDDKIARGLPKRVFRRLRDHRF
jgi:hypothetical protein